MVVRVDFTPRPRRWLVWLPLPLFAIAIGIAWPFEPAIAHESRVFLTALNFILATLVSLFVAYLCASSFRVTGELGVLLLGCGVMVWGLASGIAAFSFPHGVNASVAIHNLGVWHCGALSLAGAAVANSSRKSVGMPGPWLALAYLGGMAATILIAVATLEDWMPVFFVQGAGGTPLRQAVLGSSAAMLGVTSAVLWRLDRRSPSTFLQWYSPGLALLAMSLLGTWFETVEGGVLGWTARAAQYLGGLYLLIAGIAAVRDARGWRTSLAEALRASQQRYSAFAAATFEGIVESRAGRIVACNEQFAQMAGWTVPGLLGKEITDLVAPEDRTRVSANIAANIASVIEHRMVRQDGSHIVVEARGRPVASGETHRFTALRDITERKRAEERVARLTRLYAVLSRVNEAIVRVHDRLELYRDICRIVAEAGQFALVWIGEVEGRRVVPRAASGSAVDYLDDVQVEIDGPLALGPTGRAIRLNQHSVNDDFAINPTMAPWREAARRYGLRASASFPLRLLDTTVGAVTLYASTPNAFDDEDVGLLDALAADLSYALDALERNRLRSEAAEQLRQSEERFRVIAASTPDHLFVQDRDLRYRLIVNPQLGMSEDDLLGRTDYEILGPNDAEKLTGLKRRVLATGTPLHLELPVTSLAGTTEYFEGSYVPRRDANGAVDGVIGYFRNVTERRRVEDALQRSEEERKVAEAVRDERQRLFQVLETLPAMICLLTADHHVAFANRAFRAEFGEANGRRCFDYCFGRSEPCEFCESYRVLESGRPHHWEITTPRGTVISVNDLPFTDTDGTPMILEMDLDITESRRSEQALRDAHERLAKRAAQLRVLAGELTLSEQRERRRLAAFLHDHLQQLLVAAKYRAAALAQGGFGASSSAAGEIEQLLDTAIFEARSLTAEISPPTVRGGGLPADMAWLVRWTADKHGLRVDLAVADDLPDLPQDVRVLLFESVRELLFNAAKHANVRSLQLEVGRTPEPGIRITVTDQGEGFDPGEIKKTGEASGKFGLVSIQERLDLLGGSMTIESARGKGSRFTLTVGTGGGASGEGAAATPTREATRNAGFVGTLRGEQAGRPTRVLLAEDHEVVREGLTRLLGFESDIEVVGEAADGAEAVALAAALKPDVILMDINMPRLNGIEATRIIHRQQPDVCVIGLSMFDDDLHAREMLNAGAVAYLSKSGPPSELIAAIGDARRLRR